MVEKAEESPVIQAVAIDDDIDVQLPVAQEVHPVDDEPSSVLGAKYYKRPTPEMLERAKSKNSIGILSSNELSGVFCMPKTIHATSGLGEVKIDASFAEFVLPVTTVTVSALLGEVKITIPRGVRVENDVFGILSSVKCNSEQRSLSADGPMLVIKGGSLLAEVKVKVNENCPVLKVVD